MPFHVEIGFSLNHARAFNLSREELLATVLEPWLEDRPIELGEREWPPADSGLKILEGPRLDTSDLSFGQGWSNAERSAEDVTRRELAQAPRPKSPDAFVVETDIPEEMVGEMVDGQEVRPVAWAEARGRIDGRDPTVAAVILVVKRPRADPPRS